MSEWSTVTLKHGSATIIVRRPVLSEAERLKREKQAAEVLGYTMQGYLKRTQSA